MRDPRLNPKAGDEIKQQSGVHLRVTDVGEDCISWQRKQAKQWAHDNSWTLRGWINVVAHGAKVVSIAV